MAKHFFILTLLSAFWFCGFAQTPMHTFLQKHTDSTIIIEYDNQSYDPHYYHILTKTDDKINSFTYNLIEKWEKFKGSKPLEIAIQMEKSADASKPAAVNSYFNIYPISSDTLKSVWKNLNTHALWKIKNGKDIPPCKSHKKRTPIMDCGGITIYLLTKKEIKTLNYDCPWNYENKCAEDWSRIIAIKTHDIFNRYFKTAK